MIELVSAAVHGECHMSTAPGTEHEHAIQMPAMITACIQIEHGCRSYLMLGNRRGADDRLLVTALASTSDIVTSRVMSMCTGCSGYPHTSRDVPGSWSHHAISTHISGLPTFISGVGPGDDPRLHGHSYARAWSADPQSMVWHRNMRKVYQTFG